MSRKLDSLSIEPLIEDEAVRSALLAMDVLLLGIKGIGLVIRFDPLGDVAADVVLESETLTCLETDLGSLLGSEDG